MQQDLVAHGLGVPIVASEVDPLTLIFTLKALDDSSHVCMKIYV